MCRTLISMTVVLLVCCSAASPATLYLKVQTDSDTYNVGDAVNWTVSAWASNGDNSGIALVGVDLNDDTGEAISVATAFSPDFISFIINSLGTPSATPPHLQDVFASQFAKTLDVANDGNEHIFVTGSYIVSIEGLHTLNVSPRSGTYWPDADSNAMPFESVDTSEDSTTFTVIPEPGTLVLLVSGGLSCILRRRKRRHPQTR